MIYKCMKCEVVWAKTAQIKRVLKPTPRVCPDCELKK